MNKQNPYLDAFNALQAEDMNKQMKTKLEKLREDAEEKDEKRRLRRSGRGDGPPALTTLRRMKTDEQTDED